MGNGIPEIRLTVFKGDEQVGDHQFAQPVVVLGRAASADLVVRDDAVLPLHAEIRVDSAGGLSIADLGTAGEMLHLMVFTVGVNFRGGL